MRTRSLVPSWTRATPGHSPGVSASVKSGVENLWGKTDIHVSQRNYPRMIIHQKHRRNDKTYSENTYQPTDGHPLVWMVGVRIHLFWQDDRLLFLQLSRGSSWRILWPLSGP